MLADWRSRQGSLQGTALLHTLCPALFCHFVEHLTVWGVELIATHQAPWLDSTGLLQVCLALFAVVFVYSQYLCPL